MHLKKVKVESQNAPITYYGVCSSCLGTAKKSRGYKRRKWESDLDQANLAPQALIQPCKKCQGTGLIAQNQAQNIDTVNFPTLAIVGAGIGGVALALALSQRGIPFYLFERDQSFDDRAQGYGLTLQQANRIIKDFGLSLHDSGVVSTRHIVHNAQGEVLGEWGDRKYGQKESGKTKKTNMHIARQTLRHAFVSELEKNHQILWGHKLLYYSANEKGYTLLVDKGGVEQQFQADIVVAADGIRSKVRQVLLGHKDSELNYLDTFVILGICPLEKLEDLQSDLLDGKTVFQSADGHQRIYVMPYDHTSIMWQYSIPMHKQQALELGGCSEDELHQFAQKQLKWHRPIPQIIERTPVELISGYPVYDRALLDPKSMQNAHCTTLIGDAAHPMSPFKGQGANQALLDALELARTIYTQTGKYNTWTTPGYLAEVLRNFEQHMLQRSKAKVVGSKQAVVNLHCAKVLKVRDQTRGGDQ